MRFATCWRWTSSPGRRCRWTIPATASTISATCCRCRRRCWKSTCRRRGWSARLAVGNTNIKPTVEEISARRDGPGGGGRERNERASDDLPFDSRGGFVLRYYFPVDAEYVIRVQARAGRRRGTQVGSAAASRGGAAHHRRDVPAGIGEARSGASAADAAQRLRRRARRGGQRVRCRWRNWICAWTA